MQDWEKHLNCFIEMFEYGLLKDAGKVFAEIAKLHAETEFEKYRVIQDRLFLPEIIADDDLTQTHTFSLLWTMEFYGKISK